jgi:hypothetical protein
MSAGLATTRLAVYRAVTTSPLGDEVDDNSTPVIGLESLGASVIERSKRVQDPASGVWRSVPYLKARLVNPSLDVRKGDRVRDLSTGVVMTVDSLTRVPRSLAGGASLTLDLTDRAAE